ncbi:MAG: DUF3299 domain-containing protein [Planctomycetes bacterium]|nr:DUF3299 domain-containing protein [Planctomycetota bacterium]
MRTTLAVVSLLLFAASACAQDPKVGTQSKGVQQQGAQEKDKKQVVKKDGTHEKGTQEKDKPAPGKTGATDQKGVVVIDPKTGKPVETAKTGDGVKLRGTDPEDLKVQRSAQAMLAAEKKLAELIKAGKIKGVDKIVPFEEISSWPYKDGLKGMPKKLMKLDGKTVMMTGFMLPIDEVENIKEFLLVQSLWSCCYGQPPDINGTVRVVMKGKKRIDYKFEPIKIIGKFKIKATVEDGFCVDIYQLHTDSVEVIK